VQMVESGIMKERKFPATDDGTETGTPLYFTHEELALRRRTNTPYQFACQYLLNPKKGSRYGMEEGWLKYWPASPEKTNGMNIYLIVDPANAKKKENDYSVLTAVGVGGDENYYVIEWVRDRLSLAERTDALFKLHRKYRKAVKGVFYEEYGMQADIQHIESVMTNINYRFPITKVAGKIPKNDRINSLVPLFAEGKVYLPEECKYITVEGQAVDLTKSFKNDEYMVWPFAKHDDMLDCLARIRSKEVRIQFPDMTVPNINHNPERHIVSERAYSPIDIHLGKEIRA
jgi:predicted phage terminase large subunit-like protein